MSPALIRTLLTLSLLAAAPVAVFAQEHQPAQGHEQPSVTQSPRHAAPGEVGGEEGPAHVAENADHGEAAEHHEESIWGPISRLFNFLVLVGVLYYFLRQPVATYLSERKAQVRNDLVTAAEMKRTAAEQLAELERKMAGLPQELETLKAHGQQEIAAEEARIEQAAAAERERLIEQTRREIDLQLRVAQRELVEHAAALAVNLATDRIRTNITPDDQSRLVDRYLQQVKS